MCSVAIVGSRKYADQESVREYVRRLPEGTTVVSGCEPARKSRAQWGVDETAIAEARLRGLPTVVHEANWQKFGKRAGFERNPRIVSAGDRVVAFWDGESHGTRNSIEIALRARKPLEVYGCRLMYVGNCETCGFFIDYLEHGKANDLDIVFDGVGRGTCCDRLYFVDDVGYHWSEAKG